MDYGFNFVADRIVRGKAYPAFARHQAAPYTQQWREFVQHWPNTVPVELHEHCQRHQYPMQLHSADAEWPAGSFYSVGIGFFNFGIDYFSLMPEKIILALQNRKLRTLFYYHEGDNPVNIKQRLDRLCMQHNIPGNCYCVVSGNSAADSVPGFVYFPDHELLYWHRNHAVVPLEIHSRPREHKFTALSRTHKWWRATVMADLVSRGLLDNSYWSYGIEHAAEESPDDNPIEIDTLELRSAVDQFLSSAPYRCDMLTSDQHNDHHLLESAHYTNSYCSIILETHFDADGSSGAFLTEKTFRAIKHGHPFVIAGCTGSLATLRNLGYRTFDHAIDNSYDTVVDNTQRWIRCRAAVAEIQQQDMSAWFESCRSDIEHNQQLFVQHKTDRLNTLLERLRYT
jgi:hypothetical protein